VPRPPRRTAAAALLVSIGVHAALLWLATRAELPAKRDVAPSDELAIDIIETPPPVVPAPAPPPGEAGAPDPSTAPRPARGPHRRKVAPAPKSRPSEPITAQDDAPGSAQDKTTLKMRFPDLAPRLPTGESFPLPNAATLERAGVALAPPPGAELPGEKKPGPSAFARGMARQARAATERAVVEMGKAPPEAFDLLREIERRYEPSRKLVVDLAKAMAGKDRNAGRWLGRFLGGFLSHDPTENGKPFEADAAFRRASRQGALSYASRVCVTLEADGNRTIENESPSGIAELDRLARELVTSAVDRRPGLGGASRACYKIAARLERVPPVPVFACGLNADMRPECVWPLKEMARTSVTLDGVELNAQAAPPVREANRTPDALP
jgi:hypothetical protein